MRVIQNEREISSIEMRLGMAVEMALQDYAIGKAAAVTLRTTEMGVDIDITWRFTERIHLERSVLEDAKIDAEHVGRLYALKAVHDLADSVEGRIPAVLIGGTL